MIDLLILSVIIGLLRGGKLARLAEVKIKCFPLILCALLLRFVVVVFGGKELFFFVIYGSYLQIVAYLLLVYALYRNGSALRVAAIGVLLNFLVITFNGGVMPVSATALELTGLEMELYTTHTYIDEGTALWFLGDIIPIPPPYPYTRVVSIGDIFLAAGIFLFVNRQMITDTSR
ncbi:MAG: DUF5317 domain-containing protein [Dethiobacteria bacterium]|jgi:hypothetical protein|nr:DUF5317 domain-containing protein [Bacillota bacterium]